MIITVTIGNVVLISRNGHDMLEKENKQISKTIKHFPRGSLSRIFCFDRWPYTVHIYPTIIIESLVFDNITIIYQRKKQRISDILFLLIMVSTSKIRKLHKCLYAHFCERVALFRFNQPKDRNTAFVCCHWMSTAFQESNILFWSAKCIIISNLYHSNFIRVCNLFYFIFGINRFQYDFNLHVRMVFEACHAYIISWDKLDTCNLDYL